MFDPKEQKQLQLNTAVIPNRPASKPAKTLDTVPLQDTIRERAYGLYESRGREPGQEEQDWFRAEQEIIERAG